MIIQSPAGIRNMTGDAYCKVISQHSFKNLMTGIKKENVTQTKWRSWEDGVNKNTRDYDSLNHHSYH
jgi:hypothetical protein